MELQLNREYLVKNRWASASPIEKVKILQVTKTCYRIKFEDNPTIEWRTKEDVSKNLEIIEELNLEIPAYAQQK